MAEPQNGVPRWVEDRFNRIEGDIEKCGDRVSAVENRSVEMRVWQGRVMVIGILGMVILNGAVTLCILLAVRKIAPG